MNSFKKSSYKTILVLRNTFFDTNTLEVRTRSIVTKSESTLYLVNLVITYFVAISGFLYLNNIPRLTGKTKLNKIKFSINFKIVKNIYVNKWKTSLSKNYLRIEINIFKYGMWFAMLESLFKNCWKHMNIINYTYKDNSMNW